MSVPADYIAEILDRMQAAQIVGVEASGPDWSLRLGQLQGTLSAREPLPDATIVFSPAVGRFLRQHALQNAPMAVDGQTVAAGDILAIVATGPLFRPVTAPVAGEVLACLAEQDQFVEFGTPLFQIVPAS